MATATEDLPGTFVLDLAASANSNTGTVTNITQITVTAGATTIDLPAVNGNIYDPTSQKSIAVKFAGVLLYTPQFLLTDPYTYILITSASTVLALNTPPTVDQQLQNIYLCQIVHPNQVITQVIMQNASTTQVGTLFDQLLNYLEPLIKGCRIVQLPASMMLSQHAGVVLYKNINTTNNTNNPNVIQMSNISPLVFKYTDVASNYTGDLTIVDPTKYYNGSAIVSVPVGKLTIQRVGMTFSRTYLIQYGNKLYDSVNEALLDFADIDAIFPSELGLKNGVLFAYMVLPQGISTLDDSNTHIISANNFGEVATQVISATDYLMIKNNNLSDLTNVAAARLNLGAGSAGGLATLDGGGKVPSSQLDLSGVAVLDGSGKVSMSNLNTGVAGGLVVLDGSGKIPNSFLPPGAAAPPQIYTASCYTKIDNVSGYISVAFIPVEFSVVAGYVNVMLGVNIDIVDRNCIYTVANDRLNTNMASGTLSISGINNISLSMISIDTVFRLDVKKNSAGGTSPVIKSLYLIFS